jgi:hypothetical protein
MKKKQKKKNFFNFNFFKKNRKGTLLLENVIYIILNAVFLFALALFLIKQGSGAIVLEQAYSKEIALIVDSAQPVMLIKIDMDKGKKIAEENGINFNEIVKIEENIVSVKLNNNGGYNYAFFNDVDVKAYPEVNAQNEYTGMYILTINEK